MIEEIQEIVPPQLPRRLAKQIYKEFDGLNRIMRKIVGINVDFLEKCDENTEISTN